MGLEVVEPNAASRRRGMAGLPDEIWREILGIGIQTSKLSYKDLCCTSISSKSLNKLSKEDALWSTLLTQDFPQSQQHQQPSPPSLKNLYKSKFEREKHLKLAAHRRAVLRLESKVAVGIARLKELKLQIMKEKEKLKVAVDEMNNLERARSASVALNVWQPEVVRGKQKRVVEQCVVPIGSRVSALEMEIRVCKQQIMVFDKGYRDEKQRVRAMRAELEALKYHPLRDHTLNAETSAQRRSKKLKQMQSQLNHYVVSLAFD